MKIKLPTIAVFVGESIEDFLQYGMEVNVVEYFPKKGVYDFERDGAYYYASPEELYFPQLNTYNQPCFQ